MNIEFINPHSMLDYGDVILTTKNELFLIVKCNLETSIFKTKLLNLKNNTIEFGYTDPSSLRNAKEFKIKEIVKERDFKIKIPITL